MHGLSMTLNPPFLARKKNLRCRVRTRGVTKDYRIGRCSDGYFVYIFYFNIALYDKVSTGREQRDIMKFW